MPRPASSPPRKLDCLRSVTADVFIFGLPFWNPSLDEFRSWWTATLQSAERNGIVIAFANANTLNQSLFNPAFGEVMASVDVRVNDGIGFRLASKMRGVATRANLNGTDLIPYLFSHSEQRLRIFLYGATEDANRGTAEAIQRRFPNVEVVGRINGYVDPETEALPAIRRSNADVLLVALGHPRQETFCVRHREDLNVKVSLPVGGLFDFLSETKPRAPEPIRKLGMEWAYRLALEPRRMFVRYVMGNPLFLGASLLHTHRDRRDARSSANLAK